MSSRADLPSELIVDRLSAPEAVREMHSSADHQDADEKQQHQPQPRPEANDLGDADPALPAPHKIDRLA